MRVRLRRRRDLDLPDIFFKQPFRTSDESKKMRSIFSPATFFNKANGFTIVIGLIVMSLGMATALANPAAPKKSLARAMDKVADKIVSVLDELDRNKQVIIGDFISRGRSKSSGGIEIGRQLTESLTGKGITVSDAGDKWTEISGAFKIIEAKEHQTDDFDSLGIDITVEFYDENADPLKINSMKADGGGDTNEIGVPVYGDDALQLGGVSYEAAPNLPHKEKQKKIIEQYHNPVIHPVGNQVRGEGPFGVEVLVRQNGKLVPRQPTIGRGKHAFVDLHHGEEYVVRVYNDADFPITAGLKVDGVNSFIDAQDLPKNSRRIARAHKTATFKGWYIHTGKKNVLGPDHKPLPSTKAFLLSGYENSVAKREGTKASNISIGMISVDIRAAWPKGSTPPAGEPAKVVTRSTRGLATGQGQGLDLKYKVSNDLELSKHTRAVIHVRYTK